MLSGLYAIACVFFKYLFIVGYQLGQYFIIFGNLASFRFF